MIFVLFWQCMFWHNLKIFFFSLSLSLPKVGRPFIQSVDSREFSEMKVRIPLKRQYGYAILNIYTPSLILITIRYINPTIIIKIAPITFFLLN